MSHPKGNPKIHSNLPDVGDLAYDLQRDRVGMVDSVEDRPITRAWETKSTIVTLTDGDDEWTIDIASQPDRLLEAVSCTTVGDMADALDLDDEGTFDFAVPKGFADQIRDLSGSVGHFVWMYDDGLVGRPRPLSTTAQQTLEAYNDEHGTFYPTTDTVLKRAEERRFATYYTFA